MKQNFLKMMTAAAVVVGAAGYASATTQRIYTQPEVDSMTETEQQRLLNLRASGDNSFAFAPGTAVYTGEEGLASHLYVSNDIYAGGSAATQHSTVTTEGHATRMSIAAVSNIITARIDTRTGRSAGSAGNTGELLNVGGNAGSMENKAGIWSRFDYTRINDGTTGGKWNADLFTLAIGGDYKINQKLLAGMALTYGYMNGKTKFNNGKINGDQSFGITPYVNVIATNWLSFDALAGYMRVNKDRSRIQAGTKITGKPNSDRWYGSLAANAHKVVNKMALLGRLGYIYGQDKQKGFNESNGIRYLNQKTTVSRLFTRLQAGYQMNENVMPYLFATYAYDFTLTKAKLVDGGPFAARVGYVKPKKANPHTYGGAAGISVAKGANWTAGMEYGYEQSKKIKTHNGNIRLRYQF